MLSTLYIALLSSLANRASDNGIAEHICAGNLAVAAAHANRVADHALAHRQDADAAGLLVVHADLQAARGAAAEAEEMYRAAQKRQAGSKSNQRALSCRNAGWQALLRYKAGTALLCFMRVIDEPDVSVARRLEAYCGVAFSLAVLGDATGGLAVLDEFDALLQALPHDAASWHQLAAVLRFELSVQIELRSAARLVDHVYWRSPALEHRSADREDPATRALRSAAAARAAPMPLLAQRVGYLSAFRQALSGDRDALADINDHVEWAGYNGLADYVRAARIDVALALIASGCEDVAQRVLEPLHRGARLVAAGHGDLDYAYCAAKTCLARGRVQESLEHYRRHALIAARSLREDAHAVVTFAARRARSEPQLDDVGLRLPAKYRRAYAYLQANLDRNDLSVHEVAAAIGVTERALQNAFKEHLGLSPREVIRRERMERIRAELLDADQGVLRTAKKWGIKSRSTLVANYRKQFNEVPSDTIER